MDTQVHTKTWADVLVDEKEKPYFKQVLSFVRQERLAGKTIYPRQADIFNALKYTEFNDVKVVILGQDPYHGPNQAHGMCFSVQKGVPTPPSLKNIFKELAADLNVPNPSHGCLEKWAKQGVLLLNTVLTVERGNAHSHAKKGWETFTDKVIQTLSDEGEGIIFLLWGSHAQSKAQLIDPTKHRILKSTHPSPLSAHRGFLGCKHFSKTNAMLQQQNKPEIDWSLD